VQHARGGGEAPGLTRQLVLLLVLVLGAAVAAVPAVQSPASAQPGVPDVLRLAGGDRIGTALAVSAHAFSSADTVVLARADDYADALVAAPVAARVEGPILLTGREDVAAGVAEELDRLGAEHVVVMGGEAAISDAVVDELSQDRSVERLGGEDRYATAAAAARWLLDDEDSTDEDDTTDRSVDTIYIATGTAFPDALAAGPLAARVAAPILLVTPAAIPAPTGAVLDELRVGELVLLGGTAAIGGDVAADLARHGELTRHAGGTRFATAAAAFDAALEAGHDVADLWVADGRDFPDALVAGPVIGLRGGTLLLVDGTHLAASEPAYVRFRVHAERLRSVTLLGGEAVMTGNAVTQLDGILHGPELPRGGRLLFPRYRMVALYGNARSTAMGALGEQPPEQAAHRTIEAAEPYAPGGRTILPTFELIVTVATRAAGDDGMYRSVSEPHEVQRYLDVAREHGIYLLLDIQPGRSDFLTEVRRYEEFLTQPDVGIALDPEWRMGPNERPGDGVGHVTAEEVNTVVDYLADIVRRERLPQKLLVIHQFQTQMIRNRDDIRTPEELAVNIHMDGFGSREQKMNTYSHTIVEPPMSNGFKLFYDEDTNLFQPHEVLRFDVVPDLITYQ
jgi:putative cell wall-binding protein